MRISSIKNGGGAYARSPDFLTGSLQRANKIEEAFKEKYNLSKA
jgi:hypothetical protein